MISIEVQGKDALDSELAEYPRRAQRVIVRALNRGITSARTFMASEIAKDAGLAVGSVRNGMSMREASSERPEAALGSKLDRLPLMKFRARGPFPSRGRGRGVSWESGQGRRTIPNAFIAQMPGGHKGVFRRVGRSRLPIKELYGPSLGHVFAKFRAQGLARAEEMFTTTLNHELDRARDAG
jgi:hypothetical protein